MVAASAFNYWLVVVAIMVDCLVLLRYQSWLLLFHWWLLLRVVFLLAICDWQPSHCI